jgi:hypothetical protein
MFVMGVGFGTCVTVTFGFCGTLVFDVATDLFSASGGEQAGAIIARRSSALSGNRILLFTLFLITLGR